MCPHTTICVSSFYYVCVYVSSFYYVCVLIPRNAIETAEGGRAAAEHLLDNPRMLTYADVC